MEIISQFNTVTGLQLVPASVAGQVFGPLSEGLRTCHLFRFSKREESSPYLFLARRATFLYRLTFAYGFLTRGRPSGFITTNRLQGNSHVCLSSLRALPVGLRLPAQIARRVLSHLQPHLFSIAQQEGGYATCFLEPRRSSRISPISRLLA